MSKDLEKYSESELLAALAAKQKMRGPMRNDSPIGWWKLTTEDDVEGRSSRVVAIEWGHIGELLIKYAGQSYYSLSFEQVEKPDLNEMNIRFVEVPISSFLMSVASTSNLMDIELVKKFLGDGYVVGRGKHFNCVKIFKEGA